MPLDRGKSPHKSPTFKKNNHLRPQKRGFYYKIGHSHRKWSNLCGLEPQLIKLEFIIYLPKLKVSRACRPVIPRFGDKSGLLLDISPKYWAIDGDLGPQGRAPVHIS